MNANDSTRSIDEQPQDLLTPLAYALSLSPPRAPPQDSSHRALLAGHDPRKAHLVTLQPKKNNNKQNNRHRRHHHSWLQQHLLDRAHQNRCQSRHTSTAQHPHLEYVVKRDSATRRLGTYVSIDTFNYLRDAGWFRTICDVGVLTGIPALAVASPRSALAFLKLTMSRLQRIPYGSHTMQVIDLFKSDAVDAAADDDNTPVRDAESTDVKKRELIVFVHGGAWGSGLPWMYRLVALPFLLRGSDAAIVGYRTYPDATVSGQVRDLDAALRKLQAVYSSTTHRLTLMGHSSGAHIALLHLVKLAKKRLLPAGSGVSSPCPYDSFVGISGCYDISHHYDFEAARGVEELSPMKAANGYTVAAFQDHSPARYLQDMMALLQEEQEVSQVMPRHICFLHGMEDTTVPFTATSECARRFKACGIATAQEIYLAKTGHQEAIMQVMMGGLTQRKILEWMDARDADTKAKSLSASLVVSSRL